GLELLVLARTPDLAAMRSASADGTSVELALEATETIEGRALDDAGAPLGGVAVVLRAEDPEAPSAALGLEPRATTSADGAFRCRVRAGERYGLVAVAPGRRPAVRRGVAGGAERVDLILAR